MSPKTGAPFTAVGSGRLFGHPENNVRRQHDLDMRPQVLFHPDLRFYIADMNMLDVVVLKEIAQPRDDLGLPACPARNSHSVG